MITQYKCSYCHNVYEDEEICKEHEKGHTKADDFIVTKVRYGSGDNIFPQFIELANTDSEGTIFTRVYAKAKNRSLK